MPKQISLDILDNYRTYVRKYELTKINGEYFIVPIDGVCIEKEYYIKNAYMLFHGREYSILQQIKKELARIIDWDYLVKTNILSPAKDNNPQKDEEIGAYLLMEGGAPASISLHSEYDNVIKKCGELLSEFCCEFGRFGIYRLYLESTSDTKKIDDVWDLGGPFYASVRSGGLIHEYSEFFGLSPRVFGRVIQYDNYQSIYLPGMKKDDRIKVMRDWKLFEKTMCEPVKWILFSPWFMSMILHLVRQEGKEYLLSSKFDSVKFELGDAYMVDENGKLVIKCAPGSLLKGLQLEYIRNIYESQGVATCPYCKKQFSKSNAKQEYCSKKCGANARKKRERGRKQTEEQA